MTMTLPEEYTERVYAGVLGKMIGVYLGRPFEGWSYERIMAELGEIDGYVHERLGKPLIVTDDDLSGTFTFLRALQDSSYDRNITPAQIGNAWLNYIIERRTILWWGGMGNSTEHTAFLRLKHGVLAPRSGSMALNGQVVAEQIGAQIFIDGWGMVAPGDPEYAADLARRAGSVSHDGEAIYGAQVIAAMEAQAFVEPNLDRLLDTALQLIPRRSVIARLIADVRDWRVRYDDWREARALIEKHYGYHIFGGNCHMVPNHALIMLGLLYGDDDFGRSLMITNTAGWDTDCNSGNVGCLLGIKNGLAGLEGGADWRGPVADRLYLPTADGGRAITDAVRETYEVVNAGRALLGERPLTPKGGARFHWELPGSVQGWQIDALGGNGAHLENVAGGSDQGSRSLAVHLDGGRARIWTPTFVPPDALDMPGYTLLASPTLYAGQTVRARLTADAAIVAHLYVEVYGENGELGMVDGPVLAGDGTEQTWVIPAVGGAPIVNVGLAFGATGAAGTVYLDYVGWDGAPNTTLWGSEHEDDLWRRAWVNAVDQFDRWPMANNWNEPLNRIVHNEGIGTLSQGTREWRDYTLRATVRPHLAARAGIAVRVQGLRRWYGLLLCADQTVRLVKARDGEMVLAERPYEWTLDRVYHLELTARGDALVATIDGEDIFVVTDMDATLDGGGVALVIEEGRLDIDDVRVTPA